MLHLKLVEIAELKTPNLSFQIESGFVRVVALFTTEMKTHHRIYFGRALSNTRVSVRLIYQQLMMTVKNLTHFSDESMSSTIVSHGMQHIIEYAFQEVQNSKWKTYHKRRE